MNKELVRGVGSTTVDNLFAKLSPAAETFGVVIRKASAEIVYKRGTVLGKSDKDSKLVIFGTEAEEGENIAPYCVLSDNVEVSAESDTTAVAYRCGNFNRAALIVAENYTMTDKDEDELRKLDIILTDTM